MKIIGPSHASCRNHRPFQPHLSSIDGWKTPHTTTDDSTFYSEDESRRVHWNSPWMKPLLRKANSDEFICSPIHPAITTSQIEGETRDGNIRSKTGGVSQHVSEACGKMLPTTKDTPGPSKKD